MLVSHMIADKFRATATNLPWVSIPVVYLEGNHIHLLYDAVDVLTNPQLIATYIKTPNKFALSTTSTPDDPNTGGSVSPQGYANSINTLRSNSRDGYQVHFLGEEGIMLRNPLSCGILYCDAEDNAGAQA